MRTEFPYLVTCYSNFHATQVIANVGFINRSDAEAWFLKEPAIPGEITRDLVKYHYGNVYEILEPTRTLVPRKN